MYLKKEACTYKYTTSLQMEKILIHMFYINVHVQVAKAWQPSVVYIGDCEKTWMKKIPKTDKVCTAIHVQYYLPCMHSNTSLEPGSSLANYYLRVQALSSQIITYVCTHK